jgi:hypothetical protein
LTCPTVSTPNTLLSWVTLQRQSIGSQQYFQPSSRLKEVLSTKCSPKQDGLAQKRCYFLRYGVRWDYDGVVQLSDGKEYHKFQLQPNAGEIPLTIKRWREKNGGIHAVIGSMHTQKDKEADAQDFEATATEFLKGL